jgi:hypothetical protein
MQSALEAFAKTASAAPKINMAQSPGLQDMLRRLYDDETSRPKVIATPVAPKKRPRRGPQTAAPARALPIYTRKEIERRRRADEALVVLPGGIEGVQSTLQVVCALLEEMTARARAAEDREQAAEARAVAAEAREARGERREVVMLRMTVLAVILGIGAIIGGPMLVSWVVGTATWLAETGGRIH